MKCLYQSGVYFKLLNLFIFGVIGWVLTAFPGIAYATFQQQIWASLLTAIMELLTIPNVCAVISYRFPGIHSQAFVITVPILCVSIVRSNVIVFVMYKRWNIVPTFFLPSTTQLKIWLKTRRRKTKHLTLPSLQEIKENLHNGKNKWSMVPRSTRF